MSIHIGVRPSYGFTSGFLSWIPTYADNLRLAKDHAPYLFDKLWREVELGHKEGPFESLPFLNLHVSPLGVVPKKNQGKFQLIHHLSFPKGEWVNDAIPTEDVYVSYVSFDWAVHLVCKAGRGALMAKSDIESAFRLLPDHPDYYHLLGCQCW